MMRVDRILRDYADAGAVNAQVALWGFVDEHTFLTKAGHVGVVYRFRGQDTEALHAFERSWSTLVAGLKGESWNKSAARDQGVPRRLDSRSADRPVTIGSCGVGPPLLSCETGWPRRTDLTRC